MARKIIWSTRALNDLVALAEFIEKDSPLYAGHTIRRIVTRLEQAAAFPRSGRVVPEKNRSDLRELFWKEYRLVYLVHEDHIEIVAVSHGRRILKDLPES